MRGGIPQFPIYQAYLHTDKFIFAFTNLHVVKNSVILIRIPTILAVENFKENTVLAWRCGQTSQFQMYDVKT
jgi:hypothetical protein